MEGTRTYIPSQIKLQFDPTNVGDPLVRKVFEDDIARLLWMGIRPSHLVGPNFNQKCLNVAEYIREEGIPNSLESFQDVIRSFIGEEYSKIEFLTELYPYITREKELNYIIDM